MRARRRRRAWSGPARGLAARSCVAIVLAIGVALEAQAGERRALLVGVTGYAIEGPIVIPRLDGPRNDAALMRRLLLDRWGPDADLVVLADGLEEAGRPTRAAILSQLDRLARESGPGDEVLIHLAGHGAQIPDLDDEGPAEPDGLDEVFLPIDVSATIEADGRIGLRNHVTDDEIGAAIAAIVDAGAFVWLIADTCHSGTLERAVFSGRPRLADLLGEPGRIVDRNPPRPAADGPRPAAPPRPGGPSLEGPVAGGFVGFYAAGPSELAWERPLPADAAADERRTHGLLTWSVARALASGEAASYADLARIVSAEFWGWGAAASRPMFAGSLRRAPMIGLSGEPSWSIAFDDGVLTLGGGRLDGIAPGAVVAVTAGGGPLFRARVVDGGLDRGRLEVLEAGAAGLASALRRDGLSAGPEDRRRWLMDRAPSLRARLVERPVSFVLRVARPAGGGVADEVLMELAPGGAASVAIEVVAPGAAADVSMMVANDRVWLVPDLGDPAVEAPGRTPSVPLPGLTAEALGEALGRIGRARNLLRLAGLFSATEAARSLEVGLRVEDRAAEPDGTCVAHPPGEPPIVPEAAGPARDPGAAQLAPIGVGHCDRVYLELRNAGSGALDVSPFYIDPHGAVHYLRGYRDAAFFGLRLEPGEMRIVSYTETTAPGPGGPAPVGDVRLLLLALPAEDGSSYAADLRHLETAGRSTQAEPRGAPTAPRLGRLLDGAGFGMRASRSTSAPVDGGRAGAVVLPLRTEPPGERP